MTKVRDIFNFSTRFVLGGAMAAFGFLLLGIFVGTFGLLHGLEVFGRFCSA